MGESRSPWLRLSQLVFENFGLKALSLFLALIAFWMVRGAEEAQRTVFVELIATTPSRGQRMLVSELPERIRLTLKGSRFILNSLRSTEIPPVHIDLSAVTASVYHLSPDDFELPGGVEVVQVEPSAIPLTWEERISKRLPIFPIFEGELLPHLALADSPEVNPTHATFEGAASQLEGLESVGTEPIPLYGLSPGRYERQVGFARLPSHVQPLGPRLVTVRFEIKQKLIEKVLNSEISAIGQAVRELRPSHLRIALRGTDEALQGLDAASIVAYVDARELEGSGATGAHFLPVQIKGIPQGVEVLSMEPQEALVFLHPPTPSKR
ncbi:MAG: hypothetical protein NZM37_03365 [Sandaracinaceae bacterium]|nr:hypothetical protein [Sandaracinaceae bacterium]